VLQIKIFIFDNHLLKDLHTNSIFNT
jgi:hypothetical protein